MAIEVMCSNCFSAYRVNARFVGEIVACKACKTPMHVPTLADLEQFDPDVDILAQSSGSHPTRLPPRRRKKKNAAAGDRQGRDSNDENTGTQKATFNMSRIAALFLIASSALFMIVGGIGITEREPAAYRGVGYGILGVVWGFWCLRKAKLT